MTKISVHIEGHYEVKEDPFSRTYEWQPGCVVLECDCGQELTLSGASTVPTCRCGANHSEIVQDLIIQDLQEREGRLRDEVTHPWHYDTKEQAQQPPQDEAAYPKGSPWRYNNVTSGEVDDV
jgi:hypothetical protein